MGTTKTTKGARTQLPTSMADLGSITRLYPNYFNAFSLGFVLDETLKLVETPVANPVVHSLSFSLFSYPFEVFHNDFVSIKVGNDVLADVVVSPSHKPFFSSRELLEKPLARMSAFSLEFVTQVFELPLDLFNFGRIIKPVVACDCEIVYSEVNAENNIMRSVVSDINLSGEREQEKSPAFSVHSQKAFFEFPTEIFFITLRDVKDKILSLLEQPQREDISFGFSTSWEIIPDRSMINNWFSFSLLDYSTSLFDTSNRELCWEGFPQSLVNKGMKSDIVIDSLLPSSIDTDLQSFSIGFDSSDCLFSCANFDFSCGDTTHTEYRTEQVFKTIGGFAFLSTINCWVSSEYIL